MNFRTKIKIEQPNFDINHQTHLMSIGSCFSNNIGDKLFENKFHISINPFGVLYNPASISSVLKRILSAKPFSKDELVKHDNLFQSFMHHSSFSSANEEECLNKINNSFSNAVQSLQQTDILLITFGTAYIYRLKTNGDVVANCHKFPAVTFARHRLTVDEIVEDWTEIVELLQSINPLVKIIFTVSPIRHWKDGAHENQISKSILHIAIDELQRIYDRQIYYFPAYEILIDELRDYRFYDNDMMHPAPVAVEYIWTKFNETYFDNHTTGIIKQCQQINRAVNHRPHNINNEKYITFVKQTINQIKQLQLKYPYINFDNEINSLLEKTKA